MRIKHRQKTDRQTDRRQTHASSWKCYQVELQQLQTTDIISLDPTISPGRIDGRGS